jgi:superoxide reductase
MLTKTKEAQEQCEKDVLCGVHYIQDTSGLSDLEKKHVPVITAPEKVKKGECFEVKVEVGKLLEHPNEPGHFIQVIDLYADDTFLVRMDLTPRMTCPVLTTVVRLDHVYDNLRAFERCNLHGTWETEVPIAVMD